MFVVRSWQLLLLSASFVTAGCSLLYDLNTRQCEIHADCERLGTNLRCESSVCQVNGGGGGGSGVSLGGSTGSAGLAGSATGGTAGGPGFVSCKSSAECVAVFGTSDPHLCIQGQCQRSTAECSSHADCFYKHGEVEPIACVQGACVPLLSDECPVVLPRLTGTADIYALLKRSNAAIIGAFAYVSPSSLDGIAVRNIDLVLRDFAEKTNGVVLSGERRDVVAVVCSSNEGDSASILEAGRHLAYDLDVPAILTALPASDAQRLFETFRAERGKNVFMLMPNYTDETLINLEDDSLIWHMLSNANSLGASYQPLLGLTETHLRNGGKLTAATSLRVALISATDERFLKDLGSAIKGRIQFNGNLTAAENSPGSFLEFGTTSYTTDTAHTYDHAPMVNSLLGFAPHVVIAATGEEMLDKIIPLIEQKWAAAAGTQPKPFYLLSPFHYNSSYLARLDEYPTVRSRMASVNWPGAVDATLYDAYLDRYTLTFGVRNEGYENYYDAAYYLVYAMAGGRSASATAIAAGFKRLLAGTEYRVGQTDMVGLLNRLASPTGDVRLVGTMGNANWSVITGGRTDAGSVWCVTPTGEQHSDVLRPSTPTMSGEVESLSGKFDCFAFPQAPP